MMREKQNSVPSEILTVKQEIQRMTFIFMSVSFLSPERRMRKQKYDLCTEIYVENRSL